MAPHINRAVPPDGQDEDGLGRLLAERGDHLLHTATALTGSRADGEDLLQAAAERLLRRHRRIDDLEAYLRRVLYNLAADGWRKRGVWHRWRPLLPSQPEAGNGPGAVHLVDLRDALFQALRQLPPRQRTVLVLRYWEELTQTETAALLGCSEGTVKSTASRGLARLRELTADWHEAQPHLVNGVTGATARTKETP